MIFDMNVPPLSSKKHAVIEYSLLKPWIREQLWKWFFYETIMDMQKLHPDTDYAPMLCFHYCTVAGKLDCLLVLKALKEAVKLTPPPPLSYFNSVESTPKRILTEGWCYQLARWPSGITLHKTDVPSRELKRKFWNSRVLELVFYEECMIDGKACVLVCEKVYTTTANVFRVEEILYLIRRHYARPILDRQVEHIVRDERINHCTPIDLSWECKRQSKPGYRIDVREVSIEKLNCVQLKVVRIPMLRETTTYATLRRQKSPIHMDEQENLVELQPKAQLRKKVSFNEQVTEVPPLPSSPPLEVELNHNLKEEVSTTTKSKKSKKKLLKKLWK